VLARAVVVHPLRTTALRRDREAALLVEGRVGPAPEIAPRQPRSPEHPIHDRHVGLGTVMTRARQRQLPRPEPQTIRDPALQERQRLERLDRRARPERGLDVAPSPDPASRRHDDDSTPVHRLDAVTPRHDRKLDVTVLTELSAART